LAKEALFNIQDIEDYISQDNQIAAIKFTDKFISLVEELIHFQQKGRVVPELSINQISEIIYKNYMILYLIKKNSIKISALLGSYKISL